MPYTQHDFARYMYEQYGLTPEDLAGGDVDINEIEPDDLEDEYEDPSEDDEYEDPSEDEQDYDDEN